MLNQTQKIRLNYISLPTDFLRELKQAGKRGKARAFCEYFDDLDAGEINSFGFYAKSWNVSKSTAFEWIAEFRGEIELYHAHWILKNAQHYNSVQKSAERPPNDSIPQEVRKDGHFENTAERLPNKDLNNISSSKEGVVNFYDAEFEDFYFGCRLSNKRVGKKDEIFAEYQNHTHINHKDMRFAYFCYLNDKKAARENRHFGLVKFMQNQVYYNYINVRVRIDIGGRVIEGVYAQEENHVRDNQGGYYTLTHERFIELLKEDKITFLLEGVA